MNDLKKCIEILKKENAELKRQLEERHKNENFDKKIEALAIKYADILMETMDCKTNNSGQGLLEINDGIRTLSHLKQMISKRQNQFCSHS